METRQIVVIGAGALGAATAWHAAQKGAEVTLLERARACSGTSSRGVGLVNRLLWNPLDVGLVDRSIQAFRALDEASGSRFTYHDPGGLLIAGPDQAQAVQTLERLWKAQGLQVLELIDHDEVASLPGCQGLSLQDGEAAYLVEGDGWCVTTDAVQAMLEQATEAGAELATQTPVHRIEEGAVHLASGDRIEAEAIVVAAGVWTPELLEDLWPVPLQAYRPQAMALGFDHQAPTMPTVHDAVHGTYWRPDGPTKLMVGDGTVLEPQVPDQDPPVAPGFTEAVTSKLASRWPGTQHASPVRAWAGYEAATPDRRPLVGRVPGSDGIHLCVGGNGFGFMRAPALGELAACLALEAPPPVPPAELAPARFAEEPPTGFQPREGYSLEP